MIKILTVGELKRRLENVPDELPVKIISDTGVDQTGFDDWAIIVEDAIYVESEYLGIKTEEVQE